MRLRKETLNTRVQRFFSEGIATGLDQRPAQPISSLAPGAFQDSGGIGSSSSSIGKLCDSLEQADQAEELRLSSDSDT